MVNRRGAGGVGSAHFQQLPTIQKSDPIYSPSPPPAGVHRARRPIWAPCYVRVVSALSRADGHHHLLVLQKLASGHLPRAGAVVVSVHPLDSFQLNAAFPRAPASVYG